MYKLFCRICILANSTRCNADPYVFISQKTCLLLCFLTVLFSVLGAIVGYSLGYYVYDPYIADFISFMHYDQALEVVRSWLTQEYGILMIFVGAFTPIPYKVIAVGTGLVAAESVMNTGASGMLNIFNFVLVSLVGRGLRFFIEAILISLGGDKMERQLSIILM